MVIVSDSAPLLPTFTFPKLRLVGFEVSAPGETPVPDRAIVNVGLGALEVIVTVPLAFPLDVGVNISVKVVLCDALRVNGAVIPLMENPEPVTET